MENLVINRGNPRRVEIAVLSSNGVQVELSKCSEIELVLWVNGRSHRAQTVLVMNDILIAELSASELDYLGEYSAQVKYVDNGVRSTSERVYLFRVANEFFRTSSGVSDNGTSLISVSTPQSINKGYSAYEIAVQQGYEGTEEEWVESLSKDSIEAAQVAIAATIAAEEATNESIEQTRLSAEATQRSIEATEASLNQTNLTAQAVAEANSARDKANTSADNAEAKATLAQNNANLANAAATTANYSAVNADEKAVLAQSAADNANAKASLAQNATTAAQTATTQANTARDAANAAAMNATNAATAANSVAGRTTVLEGNVIFLQNEIKSHDANLLSQYSSVINIDDKYEDGYIDSSGNLKDSTSFSRSTLIYVAAGTYIINAYYSTVINNAAVVVYDKLGNKTVYNFSRTTNGGESISVVIKEFASLRICVARNISDTRLLYKTMIFRNNPAYPLLGDMTINSNIIVNGSSVPYLSDIIELNEPIKLTWSSGMISPNGGISASGATSVSNYIRVSGGDYILNTVVTSGIKEPALAIYDVNKTFIKIIDQPIKESLEELSFNIANDGYVIVSCRTSYISSASFYRKPKALLSNAAKLINKNGSLLYSAERLVYESDLLNKSTILPLSWSDGFFDASTGALKPSSATSVSNYHNVYSGESYNVKTIVTSGLSELAAVLYDVNKVVIEMIPLDIKETLTEFKINISSDGFLRISSRRSYIDMAVLSKEPKAILEVASKLSESESGELLFKGNLISGSGGDIIKDLPVSDGSNIQVGFAYIDSSNGSVKIKL